MGAVVDAIGTFSQTTFMLRLEKAMRAWGNPEFKAILKQEIEGIDTEQLPLQLGLTTGPQR